MSVTAIVGAQWGDEGKGRVIDYLASRADMVVLFQGGDNAGHTIVNDLGRFALQLPAARPGAGSSQDRPAAHRDRRRSGART